MVALDVPKQTPDRTVVWVRVTIADGHVVCKDDTVRREVEAIKPSLGPSGADPEPDWTLGRLCKQFMAARIVQQTSTANNRPIPNGVVA